MKIDRRLKDDPMSVDIFPLAIIRVMLPEEREARQKANAVAAQERARCLSVKPFPATPSPPIARYLLALWVCGIGMGLSLGWLLWGQR